MTVAFVGPLAAGTVYFWLTKPYPGVLSYIQSFNMAITVVLALALLIGGPLSYGLRKFEERQ